MKENLDLSTLMDFINGLTEGTVILGKSRADMDESTTNYLQNGQRILTLARQKSARYSKLLQSYDHIALQLNYRSMPEDSPRWQSYFMKVMKRHINNQVKFIMEKEFPVTEGISFFYELIGEYKDEITISYPKEDQAYELGLSNDVFNSKYSFKFDLGKTVQFFEPLIPVRKKDPPTIITGVHQLRKL